jgi:hypothetical protein
MSNLVSRLIPRWLERAWEETRIDAQDTRPSAPLPLEERETLPLPLPGGERPRR